MLFRLPSQGELATPPTDSIPKKNQQRNVSRKYESLIVLNTKGNDDSVDDLVGAVAKQMEAEGAKLDEIQQLGRRSFAYNARHLDAGHYVNYVFIAEPIQVSKIQERLKLDKTVHLQHYQRLS
tara:strand:- start:71 stop:439 length:369 start_codon:yes stop_codon:yes gene_type:complete